MSETVIKVENLSKQYRLGQVGTGSLSHDVNRLWYKMRGKEDPYLRIGEENDRTSGGNSLYVWALRDINFEVKQGEVLGVIGRNGAGKSTLLKILSRTTKPTTGSIKIRGRVASLLEVGTGFHPELSGRDNIFLNGAILGMTKEEVRRKFDEIVDFSGVEKYIDTPVKRYSSGMYVRLAFAVAAHLEPEILIVDEVLAVGDMEFQKKCLGKMKDVSDKDGRTVLFVSHNMEAIQSLTSRSVLMNNGTIAFTGNSFEAIKKYYTLNKKQSEAAMRSHSNKEVFISDIRVLANPVRIGEDISFELQINSKNKLRGLTLGVSLMNELDVNVASRMVTSALDLEPGVNKFNVCVSDHTYIPGEYKCAFAVSRNEKWDIFDSVIGYPDFQIIPDQEDRYFTSKWEKSWGNSFIRHIKVSAVN
jgi:lipopolysaccharide transport system ATP-binding protein